jgi:hypothetical protein
VRPDDQNRAADIDQKLVKFDSTIEELPGIKNATSRAVLVEQIIESLRRIEYAHFLRDTQIDPRRADPSSGLFDPLRAAVFNLRKGNVDEAFWLVFLATHFGKHPKQGWRLVRNVYGALGGQPWTWALVSTNIQGFRNWLAHHAGELETSRFSNHRKYQSLDAFSKAGTGAVIASYVSWIAPPRTHQDMIRQIHLKIGQDPRAVFDSLFESMDAVMGFGRLGKFDFLTMLGKLGIAPVEPGSAYLNGATGPIDGARLLFTGDAKAKISARILDRSLIKLDAALAVGMQVLEDSLCNWQKSPNRFKSFRG